MFKSSDFVSFALSMVGLPYWYGTCVYRCTTSLLKSKANQYPAHYGSNRTATYEKQIAARKVCMDCIGMVKGFFWTNGGQGVLEYIQGGVAFSNKYGSNGCPDKGANGMLSWLKSKGCKNGKIATLPDVPGILLFKSGHVGVYIGNGYAVEAQGFAYGVVKTKVAKRPWTEWAYLPASMLEYDGVSVVVESEPVKLGDRTLSKGMAGDDVGELQTALLQLGYSLPKYGADKDFGNETESAVKAFQMAQGLTADGVYGAESHAKLLAVQQTPYDVVDTPVESTPTTYTVGSTNETTIYNFLKEVMGFCTAGACGILANIYRESGFRTDCYGDSGTSYGICQWHSGRFTNLKNWCAENGKDYTSLDGQLWYLKQELEKSYKGVLSYIQGVTDNAEGAYNAGYYWCKKFEIPADTENNSIKRGELARNTYYPKYTGESVEWKLGDRTLYNTSPYMEGNDVIELQTRLNEIGFSCGTVDGKFGTATESGVKGFQTACNLEVDGKFGKLSLAALNAYSALQNEPETQYITYTVQEGDTLRAIALKLLGAEDKWAEISELNDLPNTPINTITTLKIPELQA